MLCHVCGCWSKGGWGAGEVETQCSSLWPCFLSFFCWLEMNCCFHCWQGPADLPPPLFWSARHGGQAAMVSTRVYHLSVWEGLQIGYQFQLSAGSVPAKWHAGPFPKTLDTTVRSLRLRFPCCLCAFAVLPQCWLSSLLLCLNKHRLGLG